MSLYGVTITLIDAALGLATRRSHRGVEHIPAEGPVIVVSNHLSISDPLVLGCTLRRAGRRATFMAMAEAFRWPVVGAFLHRTGQIPVVRSSASAAEAMAPALRALASGRVVALYPEGRRGDHRGRLPAPDAGPHRGRPARPDHRRRRRARWSRGVRDPCASGVR